MVVHLFRADFNLSVNAFIMKLECAFNLGHYKLRCILASIRSVHSTHFYHECYLWMSYITDTHTRVHAHVHAQNRECFNQTRVGFISQKYSLAPTKQYLKCCPDRKMFHKINHFLTTQKETNDFMHIIFIFIRLDIKPNEEHINAKTIKKILRKK